jgi:hypothetical protein
MFKFVKWKHRPPILNSLVFTSSANWVSPVDTVATITCWGSGQSGQDYTGGIPGTWGPRGGSGSYCCRKLNYRLYAGQSYYIYVAQQTNKGTGPVAFNGEGSYFISSSILFAPGGGRSADETPVGDVIYSPGRGQLGRTPGTGGGGGGSAFIDGNGFPGDTNGIGGSGSGIGGFGTDLGIPRAATDGGVPGGGGGGGGAITNIGDSGNDGGRGARGEIRIEYYS